MSGCVGSDEVSKRKNIRGEFVEFLKHTKRNLLIIQVVRA